MSLFTSLMSISLGAILVNNFILAQFLGICPFMGVSQKTGTAMGMGLAVTFVMGIASAVTWAVNTYILIPLDLQYMQTVAFILVIAALVQFVEMFLQKAVPALYQALGIYLPLITTNCAVLGVVILNIDNISAYSAYGFGFGHAMVSSFAAGAGFMLAMVLFAGVRSRLDTADVPKSLEGLPITLIAAAIVSMSFLGFTGIVEGMGLL